MSDLKFSEAPKNYNLINNQEENTMDAIITTGIVKLGVDLATLIAKNVPAAIRARAALAKNEEKAEDIRNTYEGIVSELLQEREEAVRIAQSYKAELERVVISDEDITHLHNTISQILDIFKDTEEAEALKPLKDLINIDTLKTMQLLGFNYKAAIGEPLTKLCADKISSLAKNVNINRKNK